MHNQQLNIDKKSYEGGLSTLCVGCGHDLITGVIKNTLHRMQISPYDIIKMSGIGCSSKTPGYFLNLSQGINSMHGRMAPIATGAYLARNDKYYIGISGDGDTASIGLGGFCHMIRRNPRMVYLVANNGVYGLTKGQFSPTSEIGSFTKTQTSNEFQSVDLCNLALNLGCDFVARAFVGDARQFTHILELAFKHNGLAFIDVVSPCVSFNNHDESQMSFKYVKEHKKTFYEVVDTDSNVSFFERIDEGIYKVKISDNETIFLKSVHDDKFSPKDKKSAFKILEIAKSMKYIPTGLIYLNAQSKNLVQTIRLKKRNLADIDLTSNLFNQNLLSHITNKYK